MQDVHSHKQVGRQHKPPETGMQGKPGHRMTDYIPLANPKSRHRKSALTVTLIVIFIMLALWLGLFFITGTKLFFMTTLTGISVGFIYGAKSKTRINGIMPGALVFITSLLGSSVINWHLVSTGIKMGFGEMTDHFGRIALLEAIMEKYTFWDVLFIVLAVFAAVYFTIRSNRKRIYKINFLKKPNHSL